MRYMFDKVFEALKRIETVFSLNKEGKPNVYKKYSNSVEPFYNDFDLVLNALLELQAIKEANPSEALDSLKIIGNCWLFGETDVKKAYSEQFETIKQALLKAEKLEKFWEVVRKKRVDFYILSIRNTVEDYNGLYYDIHNSYDVVSYLLTQQEFDLLRSLL